MTQPRVSNQPPTCDVELEALKATYREHYRRVVLPVLKSEIQAVVGRRGLASFMNRTKWEALLKAVREELPFPPPYQVQDLLGPKQALWASDAVDQCGDWSPEMIEPVLSIEWIRVVPRYGKHVGVLLPLHILDCTAQFRNLVKRLRVPWREDERGIWIYGYAPADPATLTWDDEKPT